MSLKQSWDKKWHKFNEDMGLTSWEESSTVFDFFYNLHQEHIKAMRDQIEKLPSAPITDHARNEYVTKVDVLKALTEEE